LFFKSFFTPFNNPDPQNIGALKNANVPSIFHICEWIKTINIEIYTYSTFWPCLQRPSSFLKKWSSHAQEFVQKPPTRIQANSFGSLFGVVKLFSRLESSTRLPASSRLPEVSHLAKPANKVIENNSLKLRRIFGNNAQILNAFEKPRIILYYQIVDVFNYME
jgi:hypothetical protein